MAEFPNGNYIVAMAALSIDWSSWIPATALAWVVSIAIGLISFWTALIFMLFLYAVIVGKQTEHAAYWVFGWGVVAVPCAIVGGTAWAINDFVYSNPSGFSFWLSVRHFGTLGALLGVAWQAVQIAGLLWEQWKDKRGTDSGGERPQMNLAQRRVHEGFRRIAIVGGVVCGLGGLILGITFAADLGWNAWGMLWLIGTTIISAGLGWSLVRSLGWITKGFLQD